jgi:hypothetical protein
VLSVAFIGVNILVSLFPAIDARFYERWQSGKKVPTNFSVFCENINHRCNFLSPLVSFSATTRNRKILRSSWIIPCTEIILSLKFISTVVRSTNTSVTNPTVMTIDHRLEVSPCAFCLRIQCYIFLCGTFFSTGNRFLQIGASYSASFENFLFPILNFMFIFKRRVLVRTTFWVFWNVIAVIDCPKCVVTLGTLLTCFNASFIYVGTTVIYSDNERTSLNWRTHARTRWHVNEVEKILRFVRPESDTVVESKSTQLSAWNCRRRAAFHDSAAVSVFSPRQECTMKSECIINITKRSIRLCAIHVIR